MKTLTVIMIASILLLTPIFAATVDLSIKNAHLESGKFLFDIFLQRTDNWGEEGLGHADWYFYFNAAAFSGSPTLTNVHPSIKNSPSVYQLTAKFNGGLLQVKLVHNGGGVWQPALNLSEQICTVNLSVADFQQDSDVSWDALNTGILTSGGQAVTETFKGNGDIALPVELSLFAAKYVDGCVEIVWRTESEVNNLGFNIHRATRESGPFQKINAVLIRGAGFSTNPLDYCFYDERVEPNATYYYQLEDVDVLGTKRLHPSVISVKTTDAQTVVLDYQLMQNYPNPFNPQTTIAFSLKQACYVALTVYDLKGQRVKQLLAADMAAGFHQLTWSGTNQNGQPVAGGTYFCTLSLPGRQLIRKMTLLR